MLKSFSVLAVTLASIATATASSEDAWAEFAAEVEDACRAATTDYFTDASVVVDPFGSENYGLAIVSGEAASIICVFDKKTKAVEIGGELPVTVSATQAD